MYVCFWDVLFFWRLFDVSVTGFCVQPVDALYFCIFQVVLSGLLFILLLLWYYKYYLKILLLYNCCILTRLILERRHT